MSSPPLVELLKGDYPLFSATAPSQQEEEVVFDLRLEIEQLLREAEARASGRIWGDPDDFVAGWCQPSALGVLLRALREALKDPMVRATLRGNVDAAVAACRARLRAQAEAAAADTDELDRALHAFLDDDSVVE